MPVQFPFGHGLRYTTFSYSNARMSAKTSRDVDGVSVTVDVTNTGKSAGKEIIQVYVHDQKSELARPQKELKGFAQVELQPGEKKTVSINLDYRAFAYYHPGIRRWITEDGDFDILSAASAADVRQTLTATLESSLCLPCILDKESTLREWMNDACGKEVVGPFYDQIEARTRRMFSGDTELYGSEGTIGMDVMEMMNDMPLISVLMFQQRDLPRPAKEMVEGFLRQVHNMS